MNVISSPFRGGNSVVIETFKGLTSVLAMVEHLLQSTVHGITTKSLPYQMVAMVVGIRMRKELEEVHVQTSTVDMSQTKKTV